MTLFCSFSAMNMPFWAARPLHAGRFQLLLHALLASCSRTAGLTLKSSAGLWEVLMLIHLLCSAVHDKAELWDARELVPCLQNAA